VERSQSFRNVSFEALRSRPEAEAVEEDGKLSEVVIN
jgi:hypothetical protein